MELLTHIIIKTIKTKAKAIKAAESDVCSHLLIPSPITLRKNPFASFQQLPHSGSGADPPLPNIWCHLPIPQSCPRGLRQLSCLETLVTPLFPLPGEQTPCHSGLCLHPLSSEGLLLATCPLPAPSLCFNLSHLGYFLCSSDHNW